MKKVKYIVVYHLIVTPEKSENMLNIYPHISLEALKTIQEAIKTDEVKKEITRLVKKATCIFAPRWTFERKTCKPLNTIFI